MAWIDLRVGYACNNRCRFCDQGDARLRHEDQPLDALVAALRAHPAEGVWLAGGEVTLRPDLPRLVAAAREAGFRRVGIQTNGRVLAAAGAAEALRRAGLTDATVAVHSPRADAHDWLTREPGSHRQALAGLRRLVYAGVAVRMATVVSRALGDDADALARVALGLGVAGHRWFFARAEPRAVMPRLALVGPALTTALRREREARIEVETFGVPLCHLPGMSDVAGDRADATRATRVAPPPYDEPPRAGAFAPACARCALRGVCPGVDAGYLAAWGADELVPVRPTAGDAAPELVAVAVPAPCDAGCARCAARDAWGADWRAATTRTLRQRLVAARSAGAAGIAFAGASPWSHPELGALVKEAERLGFARIEVWGPLFPLLAMDDGADGKLAALTAVRVPRLGARDAQSERAFDRLVTVAPACTLSWHLPHDGARPPLFRAVGPESVWAPCQP